MIKNREPERQRVTPKPNGSHLEPVAKAVAARQKTSGRTVGSDGRFSGHPEGVPAGIAEDPRNLRPKGNGTKDSPPSRWVNPKLDRTQKPSRITEKHVAKRVI